VRHAAPIYIFGGCSLLQSARCTLATGATDSLQLGAGGSLLARAEYVYQRAAAALQEASQPTDREAGGLLRAACASRLLAPRCQRNQSEWNTRRRHHRARSSGNGIPDSGRDDSFPSDQTISTRVLSGLGSPSFVSSKESERKNSPDCTRRILRPRTRNHCPDASPVATTLRRTNLRPARFGLALRNP
jgi:hypothetical protein